MPAASQAHPSETSSGQSGRGDDARMLRQPRGVEAGLGLQVDKVANQENGRSDQDRSYHAPDNFSKPGATGDSGCSNRWEYWGCRLHGDAVGRRSTAVFPIQVTGMFQSSVFRSGRDGPARWIHGPFCPPPAAAARISGAQQLISTFHFPKNQREVAHESELLSEVGRIASHGCNLAASRARAGQGS